jgi:hypothetical protein
VGKLAPRTPQAEKAENRPEENERSWQRRFGYPERVVPKVQLMVEDIGRICGVITNVRKRAGRIVTKATQIKLEILGTRHTASPVRGIVTPSIKPSREIDVRGVRTIG